MKRPRAQENVVHQGATSVAVGQWRTRTKEVTMFTMRPAIVIRLGAIHSGTSVTNLENNLTHHIPQKAFDSHQFQYFCINGSSSEAQEEL